MRKYSGVQFNFHYAFHVDGPNYCKPGMKGGHTHNHQRNAAIRIKVRSKYERQNDKKFLYLQ